MSQDYYALLEINSDASEKEINKAYRNKALQLHPDKNPDPKAAEHFHEISLAYTVLTDSTAKKSYDELLRVRKERKRAEAELGLKKKNMREELLRKEKLAAEEILRRSNNPNSYSSESEAEAALSKHLERLRRDAVIKQKEAMLRNLKIPQNIITTEQNRKVADEMDKEKKSDRMLKFSSDFESITLMKMRQAQERKRLAAEMAKEEEDQV